MIEPLTLDVRDELRRGGEPLPRILQAAKSLAPGQALRLLVTFEPLPLYAVLGRKGFGHQAIRHGEGDWEVLFSSDAPPAKSTASRLQGQASADGWPAPRQFLDNRGLLPPEPMIRILDALERLGAGEVLEALNEREPVFLYPELASRGAAIRTEKRHDGFHLLIRRSGGSS